MQICQVKLERKERGELLTDERQRATKWPEPKATSPSDGLQAEVEALLAEAAM
jgi:hypothetical protein